MGHVSAQVFVSYSSPNSEVAHAVCSGLEAADIRCWIAPRDIVPGTEYSAAIIEGIETCPIFVIIFSDSSNKSKNVLRETERAANLGKVLIPFRIDDVQLSKEMEFFLSMPQWLTATTPPLQGHIALLAKVIRQRLDSGAAEPPKVGPAAAKRAGARFGWLHLLMTLMLFILAAVPVALWIQRRPMMTAGDAIANDPTVAFCMDNLNKYRERLEIETRNAKGFQPYEESNLTDLHLTCVASQHEYMVNYEALMNLEYVEEPSKMPVVFEGSVDGPEFPHNGYSLVLFADGHISPTGETDLKDGLKPKTEAEWKQIILRSKVRSCIANLRQIEAAKEQWAMEKKKSGKDVPTAKDLAPDYIKQIPVCPLRGVYKIGSIDETPTCSKKVEGHVLP